MIVPSPSRKRTRSGALAALTIGTTKGPESLTRIDPPTKKNITPSNKGPIRG